MNSSSFGQLILVPTPIGNLADMSPACVEALRTAQIVLAEDTRTTGTLLKHFDIKPPKLWPHHQHNEHQSAEEIVKWLQAGQTIALVSDAGTPGISDPGFYLVREVVKRGIPVRCLPGPSAFIPALVCSGFPTDRFVFEGFLPLKKGRKTRIQALATESRTIVLYESPHRLLKTLAELVLYMGPDRQVSVSREISKRYEETLRGPLAFLQEHFTAHAPKGEFVICIAGDQTK